MKYTFQSTLSVPEQKPGMNALPAGVDAIKAELQAQLESWWLLKMQGVELGSVQVSGEAEEQ